MDKHIKLPPPPLVHCVATLIMNLLGINISLRFVLK